MSDIEDNPHDPTGSGNDKSTLQTIPHQAVSYKKSVFDLDSESGTESTMSYNTSPSRPASSQTSFNSRHRGAGGSLTVQPTKVFVTPILESVTEQHLMEHFKSYQKSILKIEVVQKQSARTGYIFFSSRPSAEAAIHTMNGTLLLSKHVINVCLAKVTEESTAISESEISSHSSASQSLNSLCSQSQKMLFPPPRQHSKMGPLKRELKLSPSQWNQLVTVDSSGGSLFLELKEPYQTGIEIKPDMDTRSVRFSGAQEVVANAFEYFCIRVNRQLFVPESWRKESLFHLVPDILETFQQKYGIVLIGQNDSTPMIRIQGDADNLQSAKKELEMLLDGILMSKVDVSMSGPLLDLAREKCLTERMKVYVCKLGTAQNVTVCSLSQTDIDKALIIIKQGPFAETVDFVLPEIFDEIASTSQECLVELERQESKVIIRGFHLQKVQDVATSLSKKLDNDSCMYQAMFEGTEAEREYLIHANQYETNHASKKVLSSLPAQCVIGNSSVLLRGDPQSIKKSQHLIRKELLAQLLTRRFVFHGSQKFLSQLEDFVLKPVSDDVVWIKDFSVLSNTKQMPQPKHEISPEGNINLTICSKKPDIFQQVSSSLELVKPVSKQFALPQGAADSIRLDDVKSKLENRFRVNISGGQDRFLVLDGLTSLEVQHCWSEIDEKIRSTHEIAKHVPLTRLQHSFLEKKRHQELDDLEEDCTELLFLHPRKKNDTYTLCIKGTVQKVEAVHEQLSELINSLITTTYCVKWDTKLVLMWRKRSEQIKEEQEKRVDMIIEFDKEADVSKRQTHSKSETTNTSFYIVGTDNSEIQKVGELLSQTSTLEKKIKLSAEAISTLQKKPKSLQLLTVDLQVNSQLNEVVLTAPQDSSDDLETADEEIQKYLGGSTLTSKDITCDDEVVGLVLNSSSVSAPYLTKANALAEVHGVKVRVLRKPQIGLRLSGNLAAIEVVEPIILAQILKPIQQSIDQLQVKVSSIYGSVFATNNFMLFYSKLQDEFCVSCTFPDPTNAKKHIANSSTPKLTATNSNQLICSAMVQPSSGAKCLKLEICQGSVVFEEVDAIVNAANEDLKHCGGLAKAISDAGGPTIQSGSDLYVKKNGKVKTGQAVALSSGCLSCKSVIHAVGPRWQGGDKCEQADVYLAVYKSLEVASKAMYGSIALPGIGTGIFSVPEKICASASLKAVQDFCQAFPNSTLHTIRFVLFRQSELKEFRSFFDSGSISKIKTLTHKETRTSSPTKSALSPHGTWHWENDQGSYTPYTNSDSQQLAAAFSRNSQSSQQLSVNGITYQVDLSSMMQTNMTTKYQRKVKFIATSGIQGAMWYYKDDQGGFSQYKSTESQSLEQMYQSNSPKHLKISENVYTFDFTNMCQINTKTKYRRTIQRNQGTSLNHQSVSEPDSSTRTYANKRRQHSSSHYDTFESAQWFYKDDNGKYSQYKSSESQSIERMYQSKVVDNLTIGENIYTFDFTQMCQINARTNYRRSMQRREGPSLRTPDVTASNPTPRYDLCVSIRGPHDTISQAKSRLEKELADYIEKESLTVALDFPSDFAKKLHHIAHKHSVACTIDKVQTSDAQKMHNVIKLEGITKDVQVVVKSIHQQIIDFQISKAGLETALPPEWQSQSRTTEVFPVVKGSAEWRQVEQKFKSTLSTARVILISRIQNSWLWDNYCSHKKRLQLKNNGNVNEKELFHGTCENNPKLIYEGEEGFDMRYSNQGMWGRANYFAVNASYSVSYSFNTPDGYREMFLVKVLTGDSYRCASDSSLRMPPEKASHSGKVQLSQMRYDTVTGQTGGSQVFMTYDNVKAYPAYLIKYRT